MFLGIDYPDPFDADGEILPNFREHADHGVRERGFRLLETEGTRDAGANAVAPDDEVGLSTLTVHA